MIPPTPAASVAADASSRVTWATTARRFQMGRIRVIGPIVLAVYDWAKPQRGSPRMFDQEFLEWFTWVHPAVVPAVYVPASIWAFWHGLSLGVSLPMASVLFVAGLLLWTLLEYLIHRFSFHHAPHGRLGVILAYLIHGVHHAYPEDHRRWITPPSLSFPIGVALYLGASLIFGRYTGPLGSGVALGYLGYDLLHYVIHSRPMKSRLGRFLRTYHMQHHYSTPERRYGVTTPFWDHVFRTYQ